MPGSFPIDERDVLGPRHLDYRVHAGGLFVIDAKVALRIFADFDDVLRNGFPSLKSITLVERERQYSFCHA